MDAMIEDIGNLVGAIGDAGIDTNDLVIVCGPKEAVALKMFVAGRFNYPIISSVALKGKVAAFRRWSCRVRLRGSAASRNQSRVALTIQRRDAGGRSADCRADALGIPSGADQYQAARPGRLGGASWRRSSRRCYQLVMRVWWERLLIGVVIAAIIIALA